MNIQKNMILFITLAVILLVLITIGFIITSSSPSSEWSDSDTALVRIANTQFSAAVAASASKQRTGLSSYDSLDASEAMLFVFDSAEKRTFWMKGMSFPIDIIWIDDGIVVDITRNLQPPSHVVDIKTARSAKPASLVLEVQGGASLQHNISIGDPVLITKLEERK